MNLSEPLPQLERDPRRERVVLLAVLVLGTVVLQLVTLITVLVLLT